MTTITCFCGSEVLDDKKSIDDHVKAHLEAQRFHKRRALDRRRQLPEPAQVIDLDGLETRR